MVLEAREVSRCYGWRIGLRDCQELGGESRKERNVPVATTRKKKEMV